MQAYNIKQNKNGRLLSQQVWRDHIKGIYGLTQEVLSDLANDDTMVETPNKLKFTEFLTGLSKKLE